MNNNATSNKNSSMNRDSSDDTEWTDTVQAWHFGFNTEGWWRQFKKAGCVTLGYNGVDTDFDNFDEHTLEEIIEKTGIDDQRSHPGNPAEQVRKFAHDVNKGDIICAKDGKRFTQDGKWAGNGEIRAVGVVTGEYQYEGADQWYDDLPEKWRETRNNHHRTVEWIVDLEATDQGPFKPDEVIQQWTIDEIDYLQIKNQILDSYALETEFEQLEARSRNVAGETRTGTDTSPTVWIEKSIHSSDYKQKEGWGLGEVIWCPQKMTDGSTSAHYENIKDIEPGDVILHLDQENREFTSASIAAETYEETTCPEGSRWDEDGIEKMGYEAGERPAYRIQLQDHTAFDAPLDVDAVLNKSNSELLDEVRTKETVVFNKNLNLNQGAYLTIASEKFTSLIDSTLRQQTGHGIPHLDIDSQSPDQNYFWATANPSIWSVDEIDDGSTVFYSAYNEKGNKKRLFDAFTTAKPGDRVLFYESTPVKEIVAEGTITEGLQLTTLSDSDTPTTADTESLDYTGEPRGVQIEFDRRVAGISWEDLNAIPALENAAPIANRAQGSLFQLTEDEFETILALEDPVIDGVSQDTIDNLAAKLTAPDVEIAVPENLYFDDRDRLQREIEASLRSGKHIILTGPPGTGKTKLAKAICESATTYDQVDDYRFTTATSEWTAFDTIGGYVPSTSDGGEELIFEPRLFLKCFRQDRIVNEWLIIDEINRSDIDKAFGQLFSVLSGDSTELPYERDRTVELLSLSKTATDEDLVDIIRNPDAFPVTPSWRLIATMNTYDKTSLYEMSYAFMRRFNFIHVGVPSLTNEKGVKTSLLDPGKKDNYAAAWLTDSDSIRPVLEDLYPVITVLWQRINERRVIGPSIVYDIIQYLASYDDTDSTHRDALTSAIVSLVYPQLEGMRPEQQKKLIRSLSDQNVATEEGDIDLNLDPKILQAKAADFFGISFDDDS